jgi:hypothetical protein
MNQTCNTNKPARGGDRTPEALSFDEIVVQALRLAAPGSTSYMALSELAGADNTLSTKEQIIRAADALVRVYEPQWHKIVALAQRLELSSDRPEFARAVRREVERRFRAATTDA